MKWEGVRKDLSEEVILELRPAGRGGSSHADSGPRTEETTDAKAFCGDSLGCGSVVAVHVDLFLVTYRQKASAGWRAT